MATFSPTDAGLEGFRITRENPRAFARWVVFSFVISLLGAIVTVSMPSEVRNAINTLRADDTPNLHELLDALMAAAPLVVFGLTIQCMMAAAVYRIILRHEDGRFGYLRLGWDELRLMGLTVLVVLMLMGLLVALTVASGLVMAVASAAGQSVGVSVGLALELFSVGLVIYVLVRLSLAPVETFAERKLILFRSWKLTEGQFWNLLVAYLLAAFCIFLVTLLTLILFVTVAFIFLTVTGGQFSDIRAIMNPDETSYSAYFNPGMILYMFIGSIITALWYAVIAAPGAWVYQKLHAPAADWPTPAAAQAD
jgi:hypothetical protein